ncbi:MAG: molybdate ABC transporter substrate-binding protein [Xanthobacteraceae bacterium]|uniref:molybdate ABC transporter substrate-binding protein n=1 Tax=Pseudolabrys sp. TaxID=1960880 RepID=UPI003D0EB201
MRTMLMAGAAGLSLALAVALPANAAELKILAGGSMTGPMKELGPRFEKATGHKLTFVYAGTPELIRQAASAPFDAGFVPIPVVQSAQARDKFGPSVPVGRVGYGVSVKAGARKPDISTVEKFKDVMLKAQSYTLYPESASGAIIAKTFEKLGIAEQMKPKLKAQANPAGIVKAVASGEAQYGVFVTHVLTAPGLEPPVPFPAELDHQLVFVGAVAKASPNAAAAQAFIDYLRTPEAVAVFKAKGVTPG